MIPNRLKQLWQQGKPTINGWLAIGNPFVAEIMAEQDYDSITIDIQHGFLDFSDAMGMLQAMRASAVVPMVRVPWLEPGIIMKVLDAGAYGVICPMINTARQAADFVDAVRYPPKGNRSFGPIRANIVAGDDYPAHANQQVLTIAMVETQQAVDNVDAICGTAGIDAIYVGPSDLTNSVAGGTLPTGLDREEPEMIAVIQSIVAAAKRAGIRAGIHCGTSQYAARALGWGFDFVTVSGDHRLLMSAAAASIREFRNLTSGTRSEGSDKPAAGY